MLPSFRLIGRVVFPGFYFDAVEITPSAVGVYRFDSEDGEVGKETLAERERERIFSDCNISVSPAGVLTESSGGGPGRGGGAVPVEEASCGETGVLHP